VGNIKKIVLGHIEREDARLKTREGREGSWHCLEVTVKDLKTDVEYVFF
jgi:hypothetical protein